MKAQARKKRQRKLTRLQKWVVALVLLLIVVVLSVTLILRSGYNPAEQEAKRVLSRFSTAISGSWYCENGAPKGIDNHTPWWEEIYVSQTPIDETVEHTSMYLADNGYKIEKRYVKDSHDSFVSNQGKTYWELEGVHEQFQIESRIVAHDLTLNNCFPKTSNIDKDIDPQDYASIIVIRFTDNSR